MALGKTVEQLLQEISSKELTEWRAYAALEPFGEARADLRAGIVARTVAEVHRDPKRRKRPFEVKEFMPRFEETAGEDVEQTPEQQLALVEMLNAAFGGKDLRKVGN